MTGVDSPAREVDAGHAAGSSRARIDEPRMRAWVTIAHCELPQRELVALLGAAHSPEALLASRGRLPGVDAGPATLSALAAPPAEAIEATLKWLESPANSLVTWDDDDYPQRLLELGDAPPVLFHVGRRELLNRPAVAIVGSRQATPQGRADARAFAHALASAGVTVISGLAQGIDAAAHEGALAQIGGTIAVVGTGLDRVYPAINRKLAHAIAVQGSLLSEFVPGTQPLKWHFPRRNRLISGLSRGVLVIEANLSSGSLITARLAGEQGREVMAVPGSIHSPLSKGCHKLIREGAKLVETAQDVLAELRLEPPLRAAATVPAPRVVDAAHAPLLDAMGAAPIDLERLVQRTGLAAQAIAAQLTALELDGHIAAMPGGRWQRRQ
ncbi:MAG: DNA-processing protein DprA [Casimicrobiaceae bacterium]